MRFSSNFGDEIVGSMERRVGRHCVTGLSDRNRIRGAQHQPHGSRGRTKQIELPIARRLVVIGICVQKRDDALLAIIVFANDAVHWTGEAVALDVIGGSSRIEDRTGVSNWTGVSPDRSLPTTGFDSQERITLVNTKSLCSDSLPCTPFLWFFAAFL